MRPPDVFAVVSHFRHSSGPSHLEMRSRNSGVAAETFIGVLSFADELLKTR
jgi:hypothetical protein